MRLIENELPEKNQNVIAYKSDNTYILATYTSVLTWKGRKFKFVNLLSGAGLWHDDVVGWNKIPRREETI